MSIRGGSTTSDQYQAQLRYRQAVYDEQEDSYQTSLFETRQRNSSRRQLSNTAEILSPSQGSPQRLVRPPRATQQPFPFLRQSLPKLARHPFYPPPPEYVTMSGEEHATDAQKNAANEVHLREDQNLNHHPASPPFQITPKMIGQNLANTIYNSQPRHRGGILDGLPDWSAHVNECEPDPERAARRAKELDEFLGRLPAELVKWKKEVKGKAAEQDSSGPMELS